jgi:hypothetical protein
MESSLSKLLKDNNRNVAYSPSMPLIFGTLKTGPLFELKKVKSRWRFHHVKRRKLPSKQ